MQAYFVEIINAFFTRTGKKYLGNLDNIAPYLLAFACLSSFQRQPAVDLLHGAFGIGAMLARSGAATWMMWDLHQGEFSEPEKSCLGFGQLHKDRLAQGDGRFAPFLQFDGVVDTPRGARPSSA
jgi:hypothetical protein